MTFTITINLSVILYSLSLVYSLAAIYVLTCAGNIQTRGSLLGALIGSTVPIINVIAFTTELVNCGHYKWLENWLETPLKPERRVVSDDGGSVEYNSP